jgi:ethanolamine utilization protein EutN
MRIADVIGTVTLSRCHPRLVSARWLVVVPLSLDALKRGGPADGEDLVVFDHLGAGVGGRISFSEGAEAAGPFYPNKSPVDAYCACLIDRLELEQP